MPFWEYRLQTATNLLILLGQMRALEGTGKSQVPEPLMQSHQQIGSQACQPLEILQVSRYEKK